MTDAQAQALLAEHQAVCRRVKATNVDLVERLQTLDGTAYYDPAEDWFLLSIGEPARGVVLEMADEWSWRVDPVSWQILGLEIPNVAAFERAHPPVAARIRALVRRAAVQPCTHVAVPLLETRELAANMRELIPT